MTVAGRIGACNNAAQIEEGNDLGNLIRPDDFHVEADALRNSVQIFEPVEIVLITREANTARRMPAHILSGQCFQAWVKIVAIRMNLGEVVIANEAGALSGRVPGRP